MSAPLLDIRTSKRTHDEAADVHVIVAHDRMSRKGRMSKADSELAREHGIDLHQRLEREDFTGATGSLVSIDIEASPTKLKTFVVVGIGAGKPKDVRIAASVLSRRMARPEVKAVFVSGLAVASDDAMRAWVEGLYIGGYRFVGYGSAAKKPTKTVVIVGSATDRAQPVAEGTASGVAVCLGRDLANTPSNVKSPQWLVNQARAVARKNGLAIVVRNRAQLVREGFGGIVAVGQGSVHPPALVELTYRPKRRSATTRRIVLVGKGITFDTGGLSLKPSDAMVPMKTDMSGSAAVLAAMQAIAQLKPNVEVIGLLAIAENAISGSAMRPGDVITHFGGTTVEVRNTDAEGRLVLADALAYADQELNPDVIVDLATLTGAASLGLGRIHGAMYATSDAAATRWLKAADAAGEPVWRLPLVDEYEHALDSDIADVCHISTDPHVGAGSITAALFLRRFVGRRTWLHLDIAGPARSDVDRRLITRGGTAYGTASLIRWVESFSA